MSGIGTGSSDRLTRSALAPAARRATIEDVAAHAGVSTATVSRVLSGVSRGRPATRERVFAAVDELDYRPSGVARSLKLRSTSTLGLLITDIQNPFFPELVRSIEDRARELGYALLLGNGAEDPDREATYLELLASRRVDGVLIAASSLTERHARWLARARVPTVLVNCEVEDGSLSAALSENREGGRIAAAHLLALGHRRLAVITQARHDRPAQDRVQGVRDTLSAAGLDGSALAIARGDSHVPGGEQAMRMLLDEGRPFTGVCCFNDLMAIGALRALRAAGRRVPDDVSVVGFDDIDLAAYAEPPLTTVAQDITALGRWAVDRLRGLVVAAAEGYAQEPPVVTRLPVRLVIRSSTGPARPESRS